MLFLRLSFESLRFAWQALTGNLLRTVLSLLGVTIGIFSIIAVFALVDSLERNIRSSMNFLGENVLYIQKWPWLFEPDYPWWKYWNRPLNTEEEFHYLQKNLKNASAVVLTANKGSRTIRYKSLSMSGVDVHGVTYEYSALKEIKIEKGRYFTPTDIDANRPVAVIGYAVARGFFDEADPLGKVIKLKGRPLTIIGVIGREGQSFMGTPTNDNGIIIPFGKFAQLYKFNKGQSDPTLCLKGYDSDKGLVALEGELTGLLRNRRSQKPGQEDSFSINRPEMIQKQISVLFDVIGIAGAIIGSFAILVGGFGIANIMFVSVKERTNIIGIQKSLGAKNYFILFQFLFEAVFLSILGGGAGIVLVYLITLAIPADVMEVVLSFSNIVTGIAISAVVGILSGIIPALLASRMDPVEAIRSK